MTTNVPASRVPLFVHRCLQKAEAALREAGIGHEPVLVAVSGGGDSMALLEIVSMLAPGLGLTLHVAWVDHRLRPRSTQEGALVKAAAEARGCAFHCDAIDPGRGDEDTLRRRRHAALEGLAARAGCRFVLLGHTADDQVETIVFRFLRGAGFGGLSGMRAVRPPVARPLLALRREQLRRLLRERGVAWAEDSSNLSWRYARGRLRRTVLPAIEAAFGAGSAAHLLDVAPRWRADEDFLEQQTRRLLAYAARRGPAGPGLDLEALREAHPALRARALRTWIAETGGRQPGSRDLAGVERWLDGGAHGGVDLAGMRLVQRLGQVVVHRAAGFEATSMDNNEFRDEAPAVAAVSDRAGESGPEGVLPPSEARVRVRRNREVS